MKSLLTVITPATSYDLTVLDTVKLEFGIDNTDQDEILIQYIHEASSAVAGACNRVFAEEEVREVIRREGYWGKRTDGIVLKRTPVTQIISFVEDDVTLVEGTDFEVDYQSGIVYKLDTGYRSSWNYFVDKITITYIGGYYLLDDLPYDLERACIRLVRHFFNAEGGTSGSGSGSFNAIGALKVVEIPGVIRREWETKGSDSYRVNTSQPPTLPSDVMALLWRYRKPAFNG